MSRTWLRNLAWRDAAVVPLLAVIAAAFWITWRFVPPAPPSHLVMATGAPGGTYQRYAEQYRRYLEPYGVTLELRPSRGAVENFAMLHDSRADVALVQGGAGESPPADHGEPPVVSLGALYYEGMWVFQRADLLLRRDLTLVSLAHAAAYAKRHRHLTAVTAPRGVADIAGDLPKWIAEQAYLLRAAIDLVRERLGEPGAKAIPGFRDP